MSILDSVEQNDNGRRPLVWRRPMWYSLTNHRSRVLRYVLTYSSECGHFCIIKCYGGYYLAHSTRPREVECTWDHALPSGEEIPFSTLHDVKALAKEILEDEHGRLRQIAAEQTIPLGEGDFLAEARNPPSQWRKLAFAKRVAGFSITTKGIPIRPLYFGEEY